MRLIRKFPAKAGINSIQNFHMPIRYLSKFMLSALMLCATFNIYGQDARVVTRNDKDSQGKPVILVKWYSQQLVYNEGVHVYRREFPRGRWVKLTTGAVKRLPDLPEEIKLNDEELHVFTEVMKEAKPEQLNGLLLMNITVESFKSADFSRFLGILYSDQTAVTGKTYQYKIQKVYGEKELFLAQSDSITCGIYGNDNPPAEFFARMGKKRVELGWKPEDERYYAVNVYRKSGGTEKKLNNQPVLISQIQDSAKKLIYPEIKFTDDSLAEGSKYQYTIAGVDFFGLETKRTTPVEILIPDQTPPPAPENLELKVDKYKVTLTWDIVPASDLIGFFIYRSTNDKMYQRLSNEILVTGKGVFTDQVPQNGGYYYFVSAVDNAGNETPSNRQFKEVRDVFPPKAPQNLKAYSDTGKITLKWDKNTEPDLMGYLIFRQTVTGKKSGDFVLLNANPVKENEFENYLPKNTRNTFQYRIVAIDTTYNKSDYSNIAGVRMPDAVSPERPFIRNIAYTDGYITVEWIANADTDLKGYNLYSREEKDTAGTFKIVNAGIIAPQVTRYTDKWAKANVAYLYYLVAVDSAGNQSQPSEHYKAYNIQTDDKNKSQVKNVRIVEKDKNIELSWQVSESAKYQGTVVFRGETADNMKPVSGMLKTDKYTDVLTDSTAVFFYQVKVYDTDGSKGETETIKLERVKR